MLLLLSLFFGCSGPVDTELHLPPVEFGPPKAGAASGHLSLPIGVPLGCFSSRSRLLGSSSRPDRRKGAYVTGFVPSAGIHTRPVIKALWIENEDDHLVILKTDMCMANDGLIQDLTARLESATGEDLAGKVILSVSHSHSAYGCYGDQWHWYLGIDRYNEEIFRRTASQIETVAMEAYDTRVDAAIGAGWAFDWDPNDKVYRDRRGENNDLQIWEDQADWVTGKDPYLNMLRIDAATGEPIAMVMNFGVHGTVLGGENALVSGDAPAGIEDALIESFDNPPMIMHLQGAGGDASPGGSDHGFARIETVGASAVEPILALYNATPTSSEPIQMETASRHIWQHGSMIEVTREGTVDWRYTTPSIEGGPLPDNIIYDEAGDIISPIDEFDTSYGAVFCGSDAPLIPGFGVGSTVFPYSACVSVEAIGNVVSAVFDFELDDVVLPFPESMKAGTTATRFGPIPTLTPDGDVVSRPFTAGAFPGEVTATFSEQFRRRSKIKAGWEMPVVIGYAQDHEGYLLIPEDWLLGGYEPNINMWGPLQAEHIMEGLLETLPMLETDVREDMDPTGYYAPTEFTSFDLPTIAPDLTPTAGTRLTELPEIEEDLYLPENIELDLEIPAQVERLSMVQLAWIGGDPMVDPPNVYLEWDNGGTWERVKTRAGRDVSEAITDILVTYTPDPPFPLEAVQTHYYWASWQAVSHTVDRAGFAAGTYRLKVEGKHYVGSEETYPWTTENYTVEGPSFEVVPATIDLALAADSLTAALLSPADGWRLVDLAGNSRGSNPVRGTVMVSVDEGTPEEVVITEVANGRATVDIDLLGASTVTVTDAFGNTGTLAIGG